MMLVVGTLMANAQTALKKVYDETIDPMQQIDKALVEAQALQGKKYVMCQVGGNWCPWCLRFADFISTDSDIAKVVADNFIYLHVNYNPRKSGGEQQVKAAAALMQRLGNPQRFGFPVSSCSSTPTARCCTFKTPASSRRARATTRKRCCAFSRRGLLRPSTETRRHNAGFLDIEIHSS